MFVAEKQYICTILFETLLGLPYTFMAEVGHKNYDIILPNGAVVTFEDHFFSKMVGKNYLQLAHVPTDAPQVNNPFNNSDLTIIYGRDVWNTPQDAPWTIGIDIFAATFFMVTRWEEYVLPDRDQYGRFPSAASLAVQAGFLNRPVVHEWAELLWQCLVRLGYPESARKERTYRFQLSCDVDHPLLWWSWWQRGKTLLGAMFRSAVPGKKEGVSFWWRRLRAATRDPFNTYKELAEWAGGTCSFNFLGKRPRNYDCWYDLGHPYVRRLIERLANAGHHIGFHPSKEAHGNAGLFKSELASLRAVSPVPVVSGRQHYLLFEAPHTWQMWEDHGLESDSTVGYSDSEGFRTGMCVAYPVFNFLTRTQLRLCEQPLIAMDVTLAQYKSYTPKQAIEQLRKLYCEVKRFNGDFVLLWHNSSLHTPEWAPYWESLRMEKF